MQSIQPHHSKVPSRSNVIPHAFRFGLKQADAGTKTEKIYVGKGRYVEDDPEKYPDKTTLAGGWAGGEKGEMCSVAKIAALSWHQILRSRIGATRVYLSQQLFEIYGKLGVHTSP